MSAFDVRAPEEYTSLKAQILGGATYVPVKELLDILGSRGLYALQLVGTPTGRDLISDFERGRFYEMKNLYEALNALQARTNV